MSLILLSLGRDSFTLTQDGANTERARAFEVGCVIAGCDCPRIFELLDLACRHLSGPIVTKQNGQILIGGTPAVTLGKAIQKACKGVGLGELATCNICRSKKPKHEFAAVHLNRRGWRGVCAECSGGKI